MDAVLNEAIMKLLLLILQAIELRRNLPVSTVFLADSTPVLTEVLMNDR